MSDLRIFSYLPNPRIAKATITARLCGVSVEVRGAAIAELKEWLWDFDARALSATEQATLTHLVRSASKGFTERLYKSDAFLQAHPFGNVPAAFSPDGRVGIFESNSIMRAVARLCDGATKLYGDDPYTASRIDSFLDAGLLFARDTQVYVLALWSAALTAEIHRSAEQAFCTYLGGIDRALRGRSGFLVGTGLSLADICFVAEMTLFHNELAHLDQLEILGLQPMLSEARRAEFALAFAHFERLRAHPAIAPDIEPYLQALTGTR